MPRRFLFLTRTHPFSDDTADLFVRDLGLTRGGDEVTMLLPHGPGVAGEWDEGEIRVRSFRYAPAPWERLGYSRSLQRDETMRPGALLVTSAYLLAARWRLSRELARPELAIGAARDERA